MRVAVDPPSVQSLPRDELITYATRRDDYVTYTLPIPEWGDEWTSPTGRLSNHDRWRDQYLGANYRSYAGLDADEFRRRVLAEDWWTVENVRAAREALRVTTSELRDDRPSRSRQDGVVCRCQCQRPDGVCGGCQHRGCRRRLGL